MVINYSDELFYSEIVLYKTKPTRETLEFSFYKEGERIFCRIKSDYAAELNKEIVLNKVNSELKDILNQVK